MRNSSSRRWHLQNLALILILAFAFLLRVIRLDFQPLWWDEGYSVFFATRDFGILLARTAVDIHPPLYYALLQLWSALAGTSAVALRVFSVIVGSAALPVLYLLARELFDARAALLATALLAISPLDIYYSQEVRMYGLVTLLGLASMLLQVMLLKRTSSARAWWLWLAYIFVTAATLYTQYYAAFILAAEIIVAWYLARTQRINWRAWRLAWGAIVGLYLPWVIYAGPKLFAYVTAKVGIEQYSRLDPLTFLANHLAAFSVGHYYALPLLLAGTLLFLILAAYGILTRGPRISRSPQTAALFYFFIPLALGYLVNLFYTFHPIRYERLLLFVAPLFYLLVAVGLARLWDNDARAALIAAGAMGGLALVSLLNFYTVPRYADEDYRPLIRAMTESAQPRDIVLALYPWQIGYLAAYYRGAPLNVVEAPSDEWIRDSSAMERALTKLRAASTRVWLFAYQAQGRILEDQIANFFSDEYRLADEWYGNTRLEYFAQLAEPRVQEVAWLFAPDVKLESFAVDPATVRVGADFVSVRLNWIADSNSYSYSLRLVNGAREKSLQQDFPIAAGNQIERRGLMLPREFAPGEYSLRLVVYARANDAPLRAPNGASEIELARIAVVAP